MVFFSIDPDKLFCRGIERYHVERHRAPIDGW
jgi:hypothetical protein